MRKLVKIMVLLLVVLSSTAQKCNDDEPKGTTSASFTNYLPPRGPNYLPPPTSQHDDPVGAVPEPSAWMVFMVGGMIISRSSRWKKKKK